MITSYAQSCPKAIRCKVYFQTLSRYYLDPFRPPHRYRTTASSSSSSSSSSSPSNPTTPTPTPNESQPSKLNRPTRPQTYYDFFPQTLSSGPPPAGPFSIDAKRLRAEFYQLQAKAHPDRFSSSSSTSSTSSSSTSLSTTNATEAKRKAESLSAYINTAYKTLQSPLLRAQYILSLRGMSDASADESATTTSAAGEAAAAARGVGDESGAGTMAIEDPELLMTVMELREAVDAAEKEADLEEVAKTNQGLIEESVKVLEEAFGKDDLDRARAETVRLKYWMGVAEGISGWEKREGGREGVGRRDWGEVR